MNNIQKKKFIIAGAGPAGLAAAYALLHSGKAEVTILEASQSIGGIARTVSWRGWRFDVGPHRFFSKSEKINDIWRHMFEIEGQGKLLRVDRKTSILNNGLFFDYPINFNWSNLRKFSFLELLASSASYFYFKFFPVKPENNLEDFYINRFGRRLYEKFFKDYTEKVWGVPCREIPRDWGAQRVKKLSISKMISEYLKRLFFARRHQTQESSLIDSFIYPSLGAGNMYERMAEEIISLGGKIITGAAVEALSFTPCSARVSFRKDNEVSFLEGDCFFSSIAIKELVPMIKDAPLDVVRLADGLQYRDFVLVILGYRGNGGRKDNWIYVHDKRVKFGRLDLFHNFSRDMMSQPDAALFGAEYFCQEGDDIWSRSDDDIIFSSRRELAALGLTEDALFLEATVLRQKKAYPSYFGSYRDFGAIRSYLDTLAPLYCIGRNGQHRYNNMDHSMLTGLAAAAAALNGGGKEPLWSVNAEEEYHEEKKR